MIVSMPRKALVAAMLFAATSAKLDDKAASKYDDMCFHCIDSGYLFCSSDGSSGKCYDAECDQKTLDDDGTCTLLPGHSCNTTITVKAMLAYTQCAYTPTTGDSGPRVCPRQIAITHDQIKKPREVEIPNGFEYYPHFEAVKLPAKEACMTEISLDADVPSTKKGAFSMTEWQDDIYIQLFRMDKTAAFDQSTALLATENTFRYDRETKQGDQAGRVPVKSDQKYQLVIINYGDEK